MPETLVWACGPRRERKGAGAELPGPPAPGGMCPPRSGEPAKSGKAPAVSRSISCVPNIYNISAYEYREFQIAVKYVLEGVDRAEKNQT